MKLLTRVIGWLFAAVFSVIKFPLMAMAWIISLIIRPTGKTRMIEWLLISAALYAAALYIQHPQIQVGLWKAGHINSAAFFGYWICRRLFGRFNEKSDPMLNFARAVIIASCIIGMALGL